MERQGSCEVRLIVCNVSGALDHTTQLHVKMNTIFVHPLLVSKPVRHSRLPHLPRMRYRLLDIVQCLLVVASSDPLRHFFSIIASMRALTTVPR